MPPPVIPTLTRPSGPGVVDGTAGADSIDNDYVDAQGDRLSDDGVLVWGDDGDDHIYDGAGDDQLWGGGGDDSLYSRLSYDGAVNGDDTLIGGAGDDYLIGSGGADLLFGDDPDLDTGPGGDDDFKLLDGDITAIGGGGHDDFLIDHHYGGTPQPISGDQHVYGGEDGAPGSPDSEDRLIIATDPSGAAPMNSLLTITGDEQGVLEYNGRSVAFHEIERVELGGGDDRVVVEAGATMTIVGGGGKDTLVLPDPVEGDPATQYELTLSGGSGKSGTLSFGDGSVLKFYQFEHIICFAAGSLIDTDQGPKPVEALQVGDHVLTRDEGYQPLVWTGARALSAADLAQNPQAAPVRFRAGSLGPDTPVQDLTVSPRHRMLIEGASADLMFGARQVLVTTEDLLALPLVDRIFEGPVTYVHVMCARHQILRANGAWSESFQPSDAVLDECDAQTRAELLALFPQLSQLSQFSQPAARPVLTAPEAQALLSASFPMR
ncbi:Hint domain-containing protein [Pararhodobacter oceanensis]|uniref:Hint domain-containing protein n=1 Tax=Pararhodobacter oceanensis TaxID=2172121 RepID=UPI000E301D5D|nr:Hint domain-containing protein [Pararhodobacter oceanensis]